MYQLKNLLILLLVSLATFCMATLPTFWQSVSDAEIFDDSLLLQHYQYLKKNRSVKKITLIELNINALQESEMNLLLDGHLITAHSLVFDNITNANSFQIWFGTSEAKNEAKQQPNLYFTIRGDKVAGKFFYNHVPYSLIPIYKNYHVLIEHHSNKLPDICASSNESSFFEEGIKYFKNIGPTHSNQDYTLRVLVALSQTALGELRNYSSTYTATHFAENALQESNLAYLRGEIPFRLKMEAVTFFSYSESEMQRDLNNLIAEKPPFDQIQQMRTQYATDIQVLIRGNEFPLAGISAKKELGASAGKAFCVMSLDGTAFTPFSLKHQIEHLVKDWSPTDEISRRTSPLSTTRSLFRQSNDYFLQYHAFARHLNWYSDIEWAQLQNDTIIAEKEHAENVTLLSNWDLNIIEKPKLLEKKSFAMPYPVHETKRDPFEGIPMRVKPNPTNGQTVVEYAIPVEKQKVTMRISTLTGQFIQFLVDDAEHPLGSHSIQWDANWLPNGVYLCTLRAGGQTRTTRITVSH